MTGGRTDVDLIRRVLAGDREAEGRFITTFRPCVAAVLRYQSVPQDEREDLAQEVFRHLWEDDKRRLRLWGCRGEGSFAAFLTVVTRRLVIDYQRCQRRWCSMGREGIEAGQRTDDSLEELTDPAPDLVAVCHLRQQADAILGCVGVLLARDAALIRQRHLVGKSYREIADEMGMTVNHVAVALLRAEARLREHVCRRHVGLFETMMSGSGGIPRATLKNEAKQGAVAADCLIAQTDTVHACQQRQEIFLPG